MGISLGDSLAGTFACLGALTALHHRHATGRGQAVDAALYESVLNVMEALIPEGQKTGFVRTRSSRVFVPRLATDVRFATHLARGEHQAELDRRVSAWTAGASTQELLSLMDEHGVPAGLIYMAHDRLADPHFRARAAIVSVHHPDLGEIKMQNVAPKLSETPGSIRAVGPELGEHNESVYVELLGMAPDEVQRLRGEGVI